jgi:hypothetical protein
MPRAVSTLAVDTTLKGNAVSEIVLHVAGGPMPQDGGIIGHLGGQPVLLRGDEILLLAQRRTGRDGYWTVHPLGTYYIRDGLVSVPDHNPCDWLDGYPIDDALKLIEVSLAGDPTYAAQPCDWSRF